MDVQVCKFKSLKGLFPKLSIAKTIVNNKHQHLIQGWLHQTLGHSWNPQMLGKIIYKYPRVFCQNKVQIETIKGNWATHKCINNVYFSECVIIKRWGWLYHHGDNCKTYAWTKCSKLDTYAPSENWHTQKH